ncbi:MAG: hypothetical protein FWE62_05420 [Firmicutes bacterium]|nr:hypothetical protein [Bacillota bacterium]
MRNKRIVRGAARTVIAPLTDFADGIIYAGDEKALPLRAGLDCYDVATAGGALKDGPGLHRELAASLNMTDDSIDQWLPVNVEAVWLYKRYDPVMARRDDRLVIWAEKQIFYIPLQNGVKLVTLFPGSSFLSKPSGTNYRLNGKDVFILCSETDTMTVIDGSSYTLAPGAPFMSSMAIHYERLYATVSGEKSAVWFSDELDPTNWNVTLTGAGFIEMLDDRGALKKVVSFLDSLYIFRTNGISRMAAYGDQTQFSVSHLFTAGGRIAADSVVLCGDRILFLSSEGLCEFDGASVRKALPKVSERFVVSETDCGGYFEGKYYFSTRFKFYTAPVQGTIMRAESVEPVLAEYDLRTGGIRLMRGILAKAIAGVTSENVHALLIAHADALAVFDQTGIYKIWQAPAARTKYWASPLSDLGYPGKNKRVVEFYVRTDTDITVILMTDKTSRNHAVSGKNTVQTVRTNISGRLISVGVLSTEAGTNVGNISAKITVY